MIINAHRGVHYSYPENSLESLLETFKTDANGIELDIVSSSDGELYVMHDLFLNPKLHKNPSLKVKQSKKLYAKQIGSKCLSKTILLSSSNHKIQIPTFRNTIESLSKGLLDEGNVTNKIFIEIKSLPGVKNSTGDLSEIIKKIHILLKKNLLDHLSTIISFDYRVIQISKSLNSLVETGLVTSRSLVDYSRLLTDVEADVLVCNKDWITLNEVEKLKDINKKIYLWTCNSLEDWENAKKLSVDGIMTDDVHGAIEYFI